MAANYFNYGHLNKKTLEALGNYQGYDVVIREMISFYIPPHD